MKSLPTCIITSKWQRGFTLIELLAVLMILSLLALMSYRGLGAVLDAREHVRLEVEKWQNVTSFFTRFERDAHLAAPRSRRSPSGSIPAWRGQQHGTSGPFVEFSRFGSIEGMDTARRLAYHLNDKQEIELLIWTGLDTVPDAHPARYSLLVGVTKFEIHYLDANSAWLENWPVSGVDIEIPRAVQLRITLASGEEVVRIFALGL